MVDWRRFDPSRHSIGMVCKGGFRDSLVAIDSNLGTKPALTRMSLTGMLVGNAHPTVYQRFWRSNKAN